MNSDLSGGTCEGSLVPVPDSVSLESIANARPTDDASVAGATPSSTEIGDSPSVVVGSERPLSDQ